MDEPKKTRVYFDSCNPEKRQKLREKVRNGPQRFQVWAGTIKDRARRIGVPCNIDAQWLEENLPTHCPALGIELQRGEGKKTGPLPASPTVDRLVPHLGYVKGNCVIISRRANCIKSDANLVEILKVARWLDNL